MDVISPRSDRDATPTRLPRRLARAIARPWVSWLVIGVWLVLAVGAGPLQPLLQESTTNDSSNFLPESAESTRVSELLSSPKLRGDDAVPAIVVVQSADESRLTPDQLAVVAGAQQEFEEVAASNDSGSVVSGPFVPGTSEIDPAAAARGMVSEDGSTALINVALDDPDSEAIAATVADLRDAARTEMDGAGIDYWISGPAGISADAIEVFSTIDLTLLIGTSVLVLVLLLAIYRSPVIAVVPLIASFAAYAVSAGLLYLLIDPLGLVISGQTTGIMTVLIFGATTDYCLLIVARYREELLQRPARFEAMQHAVRRTTPAILSSGGTVIAAMVVLLFADLQSTAALGPALMLGVGVSMLSGLTLLPALLYVVGRRAFWPSIPRVRETATDPSGIWVRTGTAISRRPRAWLAGTITLLAVMTAGLGAVDNSRLSDLDFFLGDVESVAGIEALASAVPPGALAPGTAVVTGPDADEVRASADRIAAALQGDELVAFASAGAPVRAGDRQAAVVTFQLAFNPYGDRSVEGIPRLRELASDAAVRGTAAAIGGPTAQQFDIGEANSRDLRIIIPGILLSILLVLMLLLRALVAPIMLLGTVIISFTATLGVVYLLFLGVLGQPGIDPGTVTFIFLFTAALGIDYNIFLVARIREESDNTDTRTGTLVALGSTGGVITSAGVILAGTFLILGTLPLLPLQQLGIAVAVGVLIDTVVVRGLLVPSAMLLLGERAWWPVSRTRPIDSPTSTTTPTPPT